MDLNGEINQGCLINKIKTYGIPSNSLQGKQLKNSLVSSLFIEGQKVISHIST